MLLDLPLTIRSFEAGQDLVRYGDLLQHSAVVLHGWVCRYKLLNEGRQILAIHISGDMPDLQGLYLPLIEHALATITPATIAFIPHDAIRQTLARMPSVHAALWRIALTDAAILREGMASLGRRTAVQRLGHLFCELYLRQRAVGLANGLVCPLPLLQSDMADAVGLSTVHLNRSLQDLRKRGLVEVRSSRLTILDWDRLSAESEFDGGYLGLGDAAPD